MKLSDILIRMNEYIHIRLPVPFWVPFQIPAACHTEKKPPKVYPHPPSTMNISIVQKRIMILFCLISSTSNPFSEHRPTQPVLSQQHFDDLPAVESLPVPPSAPRGPHFHRIPETFVRRTRSML